MATIERALRPLGLRALSRRWLRLVSPALDESELRLRLDSVPAAVWTTLLICPAGVIYALLDVRGWQRTALCGVCLVAIVGSAVTLRLPWDRMVRSRWREVYYVGWWLTDFAAITVAVVLAGGPRSPLLLFFWVQLVFTGLSYPRALVVALAVVTLITLGVLIVTYHERAGLGVIQAMAFVATAVVSYWETRNQERRRAALLATQRDLEVAFRQSESHRKALADSEHQLAQAQSIAHVGSWEWDVERDRLTVSLELTRILRPWFADGEQKLEDYLQRVHPMDRGEVERIIRDAVQTTKPFTYEHRITQPNGAIRSLLMQGEVARDGGSPRVLGVCQDITDLRSVEARLLHQTDHDPLTGLFNRVRLVKEIDRQLGFAPGIAHEGAVILIDIDGFGFYNDSYGYTAGDALLSAVSDALRARLRATDLVARTGPDEFAVVVQDATEERARHLADELLAVLHECPGQAPISFSIGVASFARNLEMVGDDVLVAADIALHDAKEAGGGRVTMYRGQQGVNLFWVQRIRTALTHDRFVLYGQPIVAAATRAVAHHELLIRMLGSNGEVIAPDEFLPTAERFGLITAIDRKVLAAAVQLADAGHRVALNLSAHSIGDARILDDLSAATACGTDPTRLIFEITETAAISNLAQARDFARRLTAIGCDLAIDDFGTGFGSFTYLKHLPSRYVKIDTEFVRDLKANATDREVVRAIVGIARSLGKLTVAEVVEDEETLHAVRDLGVDYVQGFHTGRPALIWSPRSDRPMHAEVVSAR